MKNDAVCPLCGDDLICIIDESNTEYVRRDYIHAKGSPKARWRRRCVRIFTDHDEAARERKALEVVAAFFDNMRPGEVPPGNPRPISDLAGLGPIASVHIFDKGKGADDAGTD